MRLLRFAIAMLGMSCLVPQDAASQVPLKPRDGILTDTVGNVSNVRELRDGRLFISSPEAVTTGDFKTGLIAPTALPRGRLIAIGRDTTLLLAPSTGWVMLADDKTLGMLPNNNPVVAFAKLLFGADAAGHVITVTGGWPADSAVAWRVTRETGARDSIASLLAGIPARGGIQAPVYVVGEQAALAEDGWIAVLRAHPYRVDWRTPEGTWILGPALPIPERRLDDREKKAVMVQLGLLFGREPASPGAISNWPSVVEPFSGYANLFLAPTGEALVLRTRTADATDNRYDLIDRQGMLVRQLELPADQKIVGFGRQSVYVRVWAGPRGGTGLIERHPWP